MGFSRRSRATSDTDSVSIRTLPVKQDVYLPGSSIYITTTKSGKTALAFKKRDKVFRHDPFDAIRESAVSRSRRGSEQYHRTRDALQDHVQPMPARFAPERHIVEVDTDDDQATIASKKGPGRVLSTSDIRTLLRPGRAEKGSSSDNVVSEPLRSRRRRQSNLSYRSKPQDYLESRLARLRAADHSSKATAISASPAIHQPLAYYMCPPPPPIISTASPNIAVSLNHPIHSGMEHTYAQVAPALAADSALAPTRMAAGYPIPPVPHGLRYIPQDLWTCQANGFVTPLPPPPPIGTIPTGIVNNQTGFQNCASFAASAAEPHAVQNIKDHFNFVVKPQLASEERKKRGELPTGSSRKAQHGDRIALEQFCAGCGKGRSKQFHMAHPLKKGQSLEPAFCRKCIAKAQCTDSESESIAATDRPKIPKTVPASTDEEELLSSGHYKRDTHTRHHSSHGKLRRCKDSESVTKSVSARLRKRVPSLETAEESGSRASSSFEVPGPIYKDDTSTRRANQETDNRAKSHRVEPSHIVIGSQTEHNRGFSSSSVNHSDSRRDSEQTIHLKSVNPKSSRRQRSSSVQRELHPFINEATQTQDRLYRSPAVHNEASDVTSQSQDKEKYDYEVSKDQTACDDGVIPSRNDSPSSLPHPATCVEETGKQGPCDSPLADNAFCSWEERGIEPEPDLLFSPINARGDSHGMPDTPADPENLGFGAHPYIRGDSWETGQSDFEQQAEQLVEEELTRAGKRCGLFSGSSASAISPFPTTSSRLTRSVISIESCGSDEDGVDSHAHYHLSNDGSSESGGEVISGRKQAPKQLEHLGFEDQRHTSSRDRNSRGTHASNHKRRYENPQNRSEDNGIAANNSSRSSQVSASTRGSSIVAHTGHSADEIMTSTNSILRGLPVPRSRLRSPRRRIRRVGLF